jgi:endonuclease YncB( thermonuclease family)
MSCCCRPDKLHGFKKNDLPIFDFKGIKCLGKIVDVYDGDTFTCVFKYRNEFIKYKFRTYGYDSPEMKPLKSKPDRDKEKIDAVKARDAFKLVTDWENSLITLDMLGFDKYGRILVNVYKKKLHVNQWMIDNGYGYEYHGGTKRS